MATSYGVGMEWSSGRYYVVIDGVRQPRTFASDAAALGYLDALKDAQAGELFDVLKGKR